MGKGTGVDWATSTWNPWYACEKVSPGCDNCYMFREMRMYGKDPEKVTRSKTRFDIPRKWADPELIFTCSWGDWFHKVADPWRDEAWQVIRDTPHHQYIILTKRHSRIRRNLPSDWPLPNVWLGVSAEDNDWFWRRASVLAEVPGDFVRVVSAEPLLGPIDTRNLQGQTALAHLRVDWVIAGGESGSGHRPMELDWARALRDDCADAGASFFLKQLGGPTSAKRAGADAVLDGRTHAEYPWARSLEVGGHSFAP